MLCAIIPFAAVPVFAVDGLCGSDGEVHWELDWDTLRIWGHGNMENYSSWKDTPWYQYRADNKVKHIIVGTGENDDITRIGSYAFAYFYKVEDIQLGERIEFIEDYAFYQAGYKCSVGMTINIPSTVFYIGKYAFSEVRNLLNLNIKSDYSALPDYVKGNTYLTVSGGLIKADGLYIQEEAFYKCKFVTKVVIDAGVKMIGKYAFAYLENLKNVAIRSNDVSIGNEAFYCSTVEKLSIGTPATTLLTNSVTDSDAKKITIGEYAFGYCRNLTDVFLSNTLSSLDYCSFYDCNNLKNVYYSGTENEFKAIGKLDNNYNDDLKNASNKKYLLDIYSFSADGDYYEINGKIDICFFQSPFNIAKKARYLFRAGIEYDEEGSWYTYPTGEKTKKIKFDHWDYDDSHCWRTLSNGQIAFLQDLEWKITPFYHYHLLPDSKVIHQGRHTETGNCTICGSKDCFDYLPYINEKGETVPVPEGYTILNSNITTLTDGWYLVDSELNYKGVRLEIAGNVKIVLLDNCGITTSGGIHVQSEKALNIYSESLEEHDYVFKPGYIKVTGAPYFCAGIGGNYQDNAGTINFYGGNTRSYGGGEGAGIGSGALGSCTVNIINGYVEGHGGVLGAGIGGGYGSSTTININGGTVKGWGGSNGSGIGIGFYSKLHSSHSNVRINKNAVVEAHGGEYADGIVGNVSYYTGSVLSEGSIWIIIVVAVVVLGGVAALVIVKKKKKKPVPADE